MRKVILFATVLVLCLCLLFVSAAYSAKPQPQPNPPASIYYYGYAMLVDGESYKIVSDKAEQYVDRHFALGPPKDRRGDRIEVQLIYNPITKSYDLTWFCCFLGRPCPVYNSNRRVKINIDMSSTVEAVNVSNSATVADMLAYKNSNFPHDPRGPLTDNSVSMLFEKGWGSNISGNNNIWAAFLVDKSNDGTDIDAITQSNLWDHNTSAPCYWASQNGAACEGREDEDQIVFFLFDNQTDAQISFEPVDWELQSGVKVPIKWVVTPATSSAEIGVRAIEPSEFDTCVYPLDKQKQVLYQIPNGLPFRLIVSKYSLETGAPPRQLDTTIDTWGKIKSE
jgi:hypothetical protein